jgi:hypothetical protein
VEWWKIVVSLIAVFAIFRLGLFMLRTLAQPVPEPDPGELRRVNLKYRCTICGAEVKMTKAGDDLPEPPRHCMEDMELVAALD